MDCGRFGIPHLSLTANWDSIMLESDEIFQLDQTPGGAGEALRLTLDQKTG